MLPGMSRAFIKEDDSNVSAEELPERPQSPHPNYVTPGGLTALQAQLAELQEQRRQLLGHPDAILAQEHLKPVERDIRYFQERIERAVVIDPANQPRDKVSFGALAATVDEDGTERRFAIVGSATRKAPSSSVSGRITPNFSPPRRPAESKTTCGQSNVAPLTQAGTPNTMLVSPGMGFRLRRPSLLGPLPRRADVLSRECLRGVPQPRWRRFRRTHGGLPSCPLG
jgi:transcription elongation GreA/GreB family factor